MVYSYVTRSKLYHEQYKTLYNSVPTSDSDLSNIENTFLLCSIFCCLKNYPIYYSYAT